MKESDYYSPSEIKSCPACGCRRKKKMYPRCWHCARCGLATCAYTRDEMDEIRRKHGR